MRPDLPAILRGYARDLDVAGPQYTTMAAILREAADALLTAPVRVIQDHQPLIYGRFPACEEE